jgi:predicted N-acetyltransferase YhbS
MIAAPQPIERTFTIIPDAPAHDAAVEALFDRAFGPGRHAKAAARLREGATCLHALSPLARDEAGRVVGACRLWAIEGSEAGRGIFLGPIAVDAAWRGGRLGLDLAARAIAAARRAGHAVVVLVGDPPYFTRLGFVPVPPGRLRMPGPVDPARLLWLPLAGPPALAGRLRAVREVRA